MSIVCPGCGDQLDTPTTDDSRWAHVGYCDRFDCPRCETTVSIPRGAQP